MDLAIDQFAGPGGSQSEQDNFCIVAWAPAV